MCWRNCFCSANFNLHSRQANEISRVPFAALWITVTCRFKILSVLNVLLHRSQANGFSWASLWIAEMCCVRNLFWLNVLLHRSQANVLTSTSLWIIDMCWTRAAFWANCLLQWWQTNRFSDFSWVLLWECKLEKWVNCFSHWSQAYRFTPVWIFICLYKLLFVRKHLLHSQHTNGFSSVWIILMCKCRAPVVTNLSLHWLQTYGFSPVWIRTWISKLLLLVNFLSHCLQLYGFSPVWLLKWIVNDPLWVYDLLHNLQTNGFSPVWTLRWVSKPLGDSYRAPHTSQIYGFTRITPIPWLDIKCLFNFDLWIYFLSHWLQLNGFSPLRIFCLVLNLLPFANCSSVSSDSIVDVTVELLLICCCSPLLAFSSSGSKLVDNFSSMLYWYANNLSHVCVITCSQSLHLNFIHRLTVIDLFKQAKIRKKYIF